MESGLASVPDGTFAVECPACPHPGRNLPEGWDKAPQEIQCVYTPFLSSRSERSKLFSGGYIRVSLPLMQIFV